MTDRREANQYDSVVQELLRSAELGRDALPYTPEFSRMKAAYFEQTGQRLRDRDFWQMLTRVGKKGGVASAKKRKRIASPKLTADQEFEVLRLFPDGIGSRDALPYTPAFDALHTRFLRLTNTKISKQDFWRAVSNIAKRSKKPEPIQGPIALSGLPKELIDSVLDQNPWWLGRPWKRTEPFRRWAYREVVRRAMKPEHAAAVRAFISQPKYNASFGIVVTQEVAKEEDGVFFVPLHALLGLR